jgi:hypothetical protein
MLSRILGFVGQRRPLLLFGAPGTLLLLTGLVLGLWVVDVFQEKRTVLISPAVISVSLCIGGTMALSTGIILRTVRDLRDWIQARKGTLQRQQTSGQTPQFIDQERHLLIFGVPGALLLMAGLVWGLWVVDVFRIKQAVLAGSAIISVSLCIGGVVALFTCIILHSLRELLLDHERPPKNKWQ